LSEVLSSHVYAGNPPDANGHSTINFNFSGSNQVPSDGNTTVSITVMLKDSSGTILTGDAVNLSASPNDGHTTLSPSSVNLDSNGSASFTMKSSNAGTYSINVTDSTTNTTLSNLGSVTFIQPTPTQTPTITPTPTSAPGVCNNAAPGSAPQLTTAVSTGAHQITLTWTTASNPVSLYLVSFGTSSGNYIYGAPNVGGQGTTTYIVGNLSTGKKYYFVVRADNGCATGNYSNELSAVAGVTPTVTPDASTDVSGNSSDTNDNSDSINSDIPTDIPTPEATPTSAPASAGGSGDIVVKIVIVGTVVGMLLLIGVFIWLWRSKTLRKRQVVHPIETNTEAVEFHSRLNRIKQHEPIKVEEIEPTPDSDEPEDITS
jgi:hypothetical protein